MATKSGDGRFDTSDCEFSLRFNQLDAEDALFGAFECAVGSDAASGVPRALPQADIECLTGSSRSKCDVWNWAAGDKGKGSPAYLEGEGGNATGERLNFETEGVDEAAV